MSSDPSQAANAIPFYEAGGSWANFTAANAGVQIKTGAGSLRGVLVGTPGTSIALYDAVGATTTPITIYNTTILGLAEMPAAFTNGLWAVILGTGNITVFYR
jgi:hypothetical protein